MLDLEKEIQLIGELAEKMLESVGKMSRLDEEKGKRIASGEAVLCWTQDYSFNIVGAARDILVRLEYVEEITEGFDGGIIRTFYSLTSKGIEQCKQLSKKPQNT